MTVQTIKPQISLLVLLSLAFLGTTAFECLEEQEAIEEEDWARRFNKKMGGSSMYLTKNAKEKGDTDGFDFYTYKYKEDGKYLKIKKTSFTEVAARDRIARYGMAEKVEIMQLRYLEDDDSTQRRFAEELVSIKCLTLGNVIFAVYKVNKEFLPALVQYNKTPEITTYMLNFTNRLNVYKMLLQDAQIANNMGFVPCYITPFTVFMTTSGDDYEPVLGQTEFFKEGVENCDHPDTTFSPPEIAFRQRYQKVKEGGLGIG